MTKEHEMIVSGWQGSRRRPVLVVVALMLAGLVLATLPGVGWADPETKGDTPTKAQQPQATSPTHGTTSTPKATKSTKTTKPARSKKAVKVAKSKKAVKAKKTEKAKKATSGNVGATADPPPDGWPQPDFSLDLPRTMRDELTGDFLGRGYAQRMRAEDTWLHVYEPPAKGGALIQSTPMDLALPNNQGIQDTGLNMWAKYGNMINNQCEGCFHTLDSNFHLSTILLATDGRTLYMTGTKGIDPNLPEGSKDLYRNLLYALPLDGSCASESCALKVVELQNNWSGTPGRPVGVVSIAAAMVGDDGNQKPVVVLGLTDWGIQVYSGWGYGDTKDDDLIYKSTIGGIFEDGISQSPALALALDSSGYLVIGVAQYNELVFTAQVNADGSNSLTGIWRGVTGSVDAHGNWGRIPISAAIGIRPDGTKHPVLGFNDGVVYIPDLASSNGGVITSTPQISGVPAVINPIPRLDMDSTNGHTDYAIASQTTWGDIADGTGYFFTDDTAPTMVAQNIALDSSGKPSARTADFDAFRSWFPGYKSGAFMISNQLSEPISVAMHSSPDSGKGCWNGAAWHGGPRELANGYPITVAAGASTTDHYTMGAYTSSTDGKCAGNPDTQASAVWRGYLSITPLNRPADTRVVNIQLNPDGWATDISDQQGGSLNVTATYIERWSAFSFWQFNVTGPDAPSELESAGLPTLTGYQLTPSTGGTAQNPTVYRLDVGPTTWSVPGLAASPAQVQALLPPLQVEGRADSTSDWVKVGQLMPNGQANVKNSQVTLPGASFYWENVTNGPTYTQFRVLTAGPNPLTSQVVDLTTLQFCYTGTKPGGPCITPPKPSALGFLSPTGTQNVMANGMDQVKLTMSISTGGSTSLPPGDDAYSKIFYRTQGQTGDLVTNLYRQDITCPTSCYASYVGVQPSVGAYLNNGASTYAATKRTALSGTATANTDYASTTHVGTDNPPQVYAQVRLDDALHSTTMGITITGYDLGDPQLIPANSGESPTVRDGFGLSGCVGDSSGSCLIAPTTATRPAIYAQPPSGTDTGPMVGLLFSNQAQNSVEDLPLTWTDSDKELLDTPSSLVSMSTVNFYLWRLGSSTALNSPHSDTSIVTHGTLVTESICTGSPCPAHNTN